MIWPYIREHRKSFLAVVFLYSLLFLAQLLVFARVFTLTQYGYISYKNTTYTFEVYCENYDRFYNLRNADFGSEDICVGVKEDMVDSTMTYISYVDGVSLERFDDNEIKYIEPIFSQGKYLGSGNINALDGEYFLTYEYFDAEGNDIDYIETENSFYQEEIHNVHEVYFDEVITLFINSTYENDQYKSAYSKWNWNTYCSLNRLFEMFPNSNQQIVSFTYDHVLSNEELIELKDSIHNDFGAFTFYAPERVTSETKSLLKEYMPINLFIVIVSIACTFRIVEAIFQDKKIEFVVFELCGARKKHILKIWLLHMLVTVLCSSAIGFILFNLFKMLEIPIVDFSGSIPILLGFTWGIFSIGILIVTLIVFKKGVSEQLWK